MSMSFILFFFFCSFFFLLLYPFFPFIRYFVFGINHIFRKNEKIQYVAATLFSMLARVAEYRTKIIDQRGGISLIQTFKEQSNSVLVARAALKGIFRLGCEEKFRELCGMILPFSFFILYSPPL